MNYLPISILGYAFNSGSIIISKIQLDSTVQNSFAYTFYVAILQLLILVLVPFGNWSDIGYGAILGASLSGFAFTIGLYFLNESIRKNEASLAIPIIGGLNPLFSLLLGALVLGQMISGQQLLAMITLIVGALVLAINPRSSSFNLKKGLEMMLLSGFFLGASYLLLREAFLQTDFINGLVVSRVASAIFVLPFLLIPSITKQIFHPEHGAKKPKSLGVFILFLLGQAMGAIGSLLINFSVSLANPALVNSLFGVQYLVILLVAIILVKEHHQKLLGESLSRNILIQKGLGVIIISLGVYLLAR